MCFISVILDRHTWRRENVPACGRFVYNAARLLGYDVPIKYREYYDVARDSVALACDSTEAGYYDEIFSHSHKYAHAAQDVLNACTQALWGRPVPYVGAQLALLSYAVQRVERLER